MFSFAIFVFVVPTLLFFWIFWTAAEGRARMAMVPGLLLIGAALFAVFCVLEMTEDAARLVAAETNPLRVRVLTEIERAVQSMPPTEAGSAVRGLAGRYLPEYAVELHSYEWQKTAVFAGGAAVVLAAAALGAYKLAKVRRVLFCAALSAAEFALAVFIFAAQYDSERNIFVMRDRQVLTILADALERADISRQEAAALVLPQVETCRRQLPDGGLSILQMAAVDLLQAEGRSLDGSN